jgi:GntR family transcriptional regulator
VTEWTKISRNANERLSSRYWANGESVWTADIGDRQLEVLDIVVTADAEPPEHIYRRLKARAVLIRDRVYAVDGRRVQWARSYLPTEVTAGTVLEAEDTGPGGTLARLSELGYEPTAFYEEVTFGAAMESEQAKLQVEASEGVARIVRSAVLRGGRVVEVADMRLVASAYRFRWGWST